MVNRAPLFGTRCRRVVSTVAELFGLPGKAQSGTSTPCWKTTNATEAMAMTNGSSGARKRGIWDRVTVASEERDSDNLLYQVASSNAR